MARTMISEAYVGLKHWRLGKALRLWGERHRSRKALRRLEDAYLRDLDLTRAEAEREARKLFWRA
ncbi:MAG: hypothetical protein WAT77_07910 [Paracoccaceae bacterium]|jgi:uncharacterized protein YjiS (DUF1127 family)